MAPIRVVMPITLEWSEPNQKWLLKFSEDFPIENLRSKFAFDFWDCGTVAFAFNPKKGKINKYTIAITEKIEGEK